MSPATVTDWTRGHHQPSLEMLVELCRILGVSADEILGLEPAKAKVNTAHLIARCERLESRVREDLAREVAALRAEIERLKG